MTDFSQEEFHKLKQKDPELRVRFYHLYKSSVYNYLLVKVKGNADVAADLFGEVNTAVLDSLHTLKNKDNLLGWVMSIAHNVYCDFVKESIKKDKLIRNLMEDQTNNATDESDRAEKDARMNLVSTAVKNLDEKNRNIIALKYFEHHSIKEIAQIINETENVVGGMLFRAKEALKKEIKRLGKYY
jgi:RNA polymerase sigma factor (sigma-70 family)